MNQPSSENIHWCKIYCSWEMYHKLSIRQYNQKFLLKWKIVMIHTGGFPEKPVFREKNPTKQQKAPSFSGSCVVLNSFLTDNLLILWTLVLIHLSLWFLAFSSKPNRILPVLLNVAWPTQLWLLVPTLLVKLCSLLFIKVKMRWRHDLPKGHDIHSIQWLGWVLWRTKQSCTSTVTCRLDQNHENFEKKNEINFFVQARYCAKCQF